MTVDILEISVVKESIRFPTFNFVLEIQTKLCGPWATKSICRWRIISDAVGCWQVHFALLNSGPGICVATTIEKVRYFCISTGFYIEALKIL